MFGFGQKRSRVPARATIRPRQKFWERLIDSLQEGDSLERAGLCVGAVLLLLVLLESWKAPFSYRNGDQIPHGIAAKIDFERVDEKGTDRERAKAEEKVPFIFRNEPERLRDLPQQLRAALGEIAQSSTVDQVSPATQRAFGLVKDTTSLPASDGSALFEANDPAFRYEQLKATLVAEGMQSVQTRIEDIGDDFLKFIRPLERNGVISEDDIRTGRIQRDSRIRVLTERKEDPALDLLLPQVTLADQLNDAGDLGKAWLSYPSLKDELRPAVSLWLIRSIEPTLRFDQRETRLAQSKARDAVPQLMQRFLRGDLLVPPGVTLDAEMLQVLHDEYDANERTVPWAMRLARMAVVLLMLCVFVVIGGFYIVLNEPRLAQSTHRLGVLLGGVVFTAFVARWMSLDPLRGEILPVLTFVMVVAIAYNQDVAMLTAFSLCLILTLATRVQLDEFVTLIATCGAAVLPLKRVASRSSLVKIGFGTAAAHLFIRAGIGLLASESFVEVVSNHALLIHCLKGAAWCVAAGYLVAGSLPFIESTFGVVTDIKLLELCDPSHPLLQELVRRAPGTYNHSIAVGSIGEAAAESIGANGLLVRVGAYFHDIGKMLKPQYFIENCRAGEGNLHESLNPAMSTLIIIGHVKDGVELGRQHHLPQQIIDFIQQHHGTTLVEYFFHEARKDAEKDPDHRTDAEEHSFRYPGPKPQTREAGVLMLADAVESASRTLEEPTPGRIENLVEKITMKKLMDGQFDECSLRLTDIHQIEQSLIKSLIGIYHGRVRYPSADAKRA
ncbi:HD family phosphohydrolase [Planctomyces sp. SH-PL14]|uniref:HD family phosphohydrolase n=1 Tax=Planctomyces sp. SH-PL14 TaxID=1632864 RepID=UPI00078E79E3|nr:HDIG domain-containing metalloprotein [Planctomyces sp. SH-PL14]AMV17979.1 Ribonuclease Y [Planctomyces sp. SH-PL14]